MDLSQVYEEMINKPNQENSQPISENCNVVQEKPKQMKKSFKGKKSMKQTKPQVKQESFDSLFQSILNESDDYSNFAPEGDDEFEAGIEDDGVDSSFDDVGGDDTVTVSRATLEDLKAQIDAILGDSGDSEDFEDFSYDDESFDDDVPKESSWDGKLSPQKKSTLVKDNGDVNFDQELDFDPTEDNDGPTQTDGPKGTFDGKLSKQKSTDHVKGNGDAQFGKVKTGFKRTDKTGNKLFGK